MGITLEAHLVPEKSVHEFIVKDIQGNDVPLKKYKGKILLIINVASLCGLTEVNYSELVQLHDMFKYDGFEILAFPSDNFGGQEPGKNKEIEEFARGKYNTFPLFGKIDVNGPNQLPLYKFLKATRGGMRGQYRDNIKWNFAKFVISKEGVVLERFPPTMSPMKLEVRDMLESKIK